MSTRHGKRSHDFWDIFAEQLWFLTMLMIPVAEFWALEWFTHNPWTTMRTQVQLWGMLFYELIFWALFFLTGSSFSAITIGSLFFCFSGTANYYVMQFRSAPIVPWDIYSLQTAASVADNYDYTPEPHVYLCWLVFVICVLMGWFFRHKSTQSQRMRLVPFAFILFLIGGYIEALSSDSFIKQLKLDNTLFTPHVMARKNGFCTSFLMDLRYLRVSEPEGYSADQVEKTLLAYTEESSSDSTPDIIVIMDEAFSDPAVLADFETNQDYMPFIHSIDALDDPHLITGLLNVSVKGGNTANTEYEFLTGNSMRFLPGGSVPYQQYIFSEKDSLVVQLNSLNYNTTAIHPFNADGWNRSKVYPYLGFRNILFNTSFHSPERVRKYISDKACFDKIVDLLPEDSDTTPGFIFAVTMQNHSSYSQIYDNFTPDIEVIGAPEGTSTKLLQHYLSLMKLTDQRLEELLTQLSNSQRKTIVLFFGDHQPNDIVVESIWKMNKTSSSQLTDEQIDLRYKVPYVLWANYDADFSEIPQETSINYLGSLLMQAAGLPLTSWQQAELAIEDQLPLITTQVFKDHEGNAVSEDDSTLTDLETLYRQIQYYQMFDHKVS